MHVRNVLVRRLIGIDEIDAAIETYETLLGQSPRLCFDYPEKQLRIVQIGQILLIGGSAAALEAFQATTMTFLVSDLSAYSDYLPMIGATIVRPIQTVPSGRNMLVRHPDDSLVEYVEHDQPHPADDVLCH